MTSRAGLNDPVTCLDYFAGAIQSADYYARVTTLYTDHPEKIRRQNRFWHQISPDTIMF
jgi:hypothetical protein